MSYASSVISILLAVWLLSHVHRLLDQVVRKALRIILVPLLSLLIVIPITLIALGPLGYYAGNALGGGITWIFEASGFVASTVVGASLPALVLLGMHQVLGPMIIGSLQATGYDYILPLFFFQTMAISGAATAVFVKARETNLKATALSTGITAFIGITEPALFGVNLPLKKPFIAALIGSGTGGALGYLFGVRAYAYAMPSILSIPTYLDPAGGSSLVGILLAALGAFAAAFAVTAVWWRDKSAHDTEQAARGVSVDGRLVLHAPVADGVVVDLSQVGDAVFSGQLMGPSMAFSPRNGSIIAPASAEVTLIAETKHAVGLKTSDGVEILLHIGIDTVKLGGAPFDVKVRQGQLVNAGDELLVVDLDDLRRRGVDNTVILALTNTEPANEEQLVPSGHRVSRRTSVARVTVPYATPAAASTPNQASTKGQSA